MKALHKVNIIKRETTVFIKSKHLFIHKLGYHTQGYIMGYTSFVQVVKMEPAYQNRMGTRTLFSRHESHLRLQDIKLLASLIQSTQNFVSSHPTSTRPSPHRLPTWYRSPRGRQARVAPTPEAPIAAAQGWQSSPPPPQARRPIPPRGAQGG
jgi:hypothetical protein